MCLPHVAWRSTSERALTAPRPDASPRWPKLRTVRVPEKAGAALSTRLVASVPQVLLRDPSRNEAPQPLIRTDGFWSSVSAASPREPGMLSARAPRQRLQEMRESSFFGL